MITLQELCAYLDKLLMPKPVSDYCHNGLQVEGQAQVHKLATAVSANLETLQAAAAWGAHALFVHHGLFWNQESHQIQGTKREKLHILLKNNISLISYHLPLDVHPELGNNWKAALDLGWNHLEPFCFTNGLFLGVKGQFKPLIFNDFQKKLEDYYQHPAYTAPGGKKKISSAGLISGGSHKFITQAITDKLDCFIAGSFDEPTWNQAFEEKINFFALGHSATERVGPQAVGDHLNRQFKLECKFIDVYNPF